MMFDVRKAALPASGGRQGVYLLQLSLSPRMAVWVLAASGDFETITFEDEPERQPGFLIKASEVEFLSPRKVEETAQELEDESVREVAA